MKILLSWLNEFAPFGDDVDRLADALNSLGLAVDGIDRVGAPIEGVITAKVLRRAPHPQADRMGLVFVDVGDGAELQICCGAFNMEPGDVVPLATVGTMMPDGRPIERAQKRGEWSNGMLCSTRELGLGDDHGGIMILDPDTALGHGVFDALGVEPDVIFELDLTRNRPDCWGHVGVARDLAAHLGVAFARPDVSGVVAIGPSTGLTVRLDDPVGCGRFTANRVTGIAVGPSPPWMARRLTLAGMRPINNIVDVSNYVMLEQNRPNHAYDEAKLAGDGFVIRKATAGEPIVTLDAVTRTLSADDCLICDARGAPIGIAGIMGGTSTEVDDTTTSVALEQAWFEPVGISISAATLGLRSEASARFERGCDPDDGEYCARRFVSLLRHSCPDAALYDAVGADGELPRRTAVQLRVDRVNAVLGTELGLVRIAALLNPIGYLTTAAEHGNTATVALPSWRYDSTSEIDVIEEIARHHGYANIARTTPAPTHPGALSAVQRQRRALRQVLIGLGIDEAMPMPFLAPGDLARTGLDPSGITITNPLVAEESVLRPSLLPGMLRVVSGNEARRCLGTRWFEIGHVFGVPPDGQLLPNESERLAVILAGSDAHAAVGVLDEILATLAVRVDITATEAPGLHPTRCAAVGPFGFVGEVEPDVAAAHGISERLGWIELDIEALSAHGTRAAAYRAVSRFPSNDVDLAVVAPDTTPASLIESTLGEAAGELLVGLQLFDTYRGPTIPAGTRSLTYALRLQAANRTLTDVEVGEVRSRCLAALAAHGITLRA
jgi:phenylalanyl-tRNA synthetase beta chain